MSWWNSSNFSDLASKALKNAQKKIDKALDISEANQAARSADVSTEEAKPKENSGGEFWSSWGSPAEGSSGASAWSLPWVTGTHESQAESGETLVKEKTAEEIKTEVLKAAKERTKAKAKLFPKKDIKSVEKDPSNSAEIKPVTDAVKDSGEHVSLELLSDVSDSKDVNPIVNETLLSDNDASQSEYEMKTSFRAPTAHESVFLVGSGFQEISESEANDSDTAHDISTEVAQGHDISETGGKLVELQADEDTSVELSAISNVEVNEEETLTLVPDTSVPNEDQATDVVANIGQVQSLSELSETDSDKEPYGTDISSSVEIVSRTDIPSENIVVEESSASEPELIECDKSGEESEDTACINPARIGYEDELQVEEDVKIVADNSNVYDESAHVNVETEIKNKVFEGISSENLNSVELSNSEEMNSDQSNFGFHSDSEVSMSKLDTSVETCTSEETLIEQSSAPGDSDDKSSEISSRTINFDHGKTESEHGAEHSKQLLLNQLHVDIRDAGFDDELADTVATSDNQTEMQDVEESAEDHDFRDVMAKDSENGKNKGDISPAHSFVKCMLEDVMDEGKQDDNSDSHSTEKSEGSRSIYSNQESGDEVDTNTSSDIEIISLPTPNGENRQNLPLDPIPLRMALQKTSWRGSPTHRRTDSSDSSNASKDSNELSPSRDLTEFRDYHRSHSDHGEGVRLSSELPALDEEDDNPYHPQRLVKDECHVAGQSLDPPSQMSHDLMSHDSGHMTSQPDWEKKLAEMSEILQARETKLVQLSKENMDLMETNSIISSQLKQSEEAREAEMTDVNELTAEFTHRLTEAEKRVSTAIREKDTIKQQLQETQAQLAKKAGDVGMKELLAEKEEQIAGLLQEGEKLSKSQLQSNTVIKKLRAKEKDNESTINTQKKRLDVQKEELDHLKKVLESKEELEKKQTEAVAQLTAAVKKQEQEMVRLKSEHEDAIEKARGLQVAVDNSYKEMAELHRTSAALDSKAHDAALSAEMHVREELKFALEKQQQQHKWEIDTLNLQIDDHRLSLARMEKESNRREELLKQEIGDLQQRLQDDEARTQELTQGVSQATRPLLRQIENLQSTYNAQSATYERVEKNLTDRLSDTQKQLAVAMEKERTANEQLLDIGSKIVTLEAQNSRLRQEKTQLTMQLEMLKTKVDMAEDTKHQEAAQMELLRQQTGEELQELRKSKVLLESQLDVEKGRVEQEKRKMSLLQDQVKDMERELQIIRTRGTPVRGTPSPVSVSRQESMMGSLHGEHFSAITQEELDRSFVLSSPNGNKQSLYEALRQSGAANLLENLQSQLKLRDGEIAHLQSEIRSLERTRESMAKELVDLSNQNDELEEKLKDFPLLETQYKELDGRYNALLQMYGEKVEEADELKMDLQDVKDMYKAQINHLLSQS
ncbi:TATA element modulatory factor-like isoform X1 [Mya arenaria]|uniref:TATA element modulatory factor-like isoform X1 n=1 Tax=Mya arenaria TaxID=6604 RepID=UPI0022E5596C|nr:TATA element modulatory factor-like isoform X1 [Mya arenaria]